MKVKVCGMTEKSNVDAIAALRPDFFGFIFAPQSPRRISIDTAAELCSYARSSAKRIAVVANQEPDFIAEVVRRTAVDGVQLHGSEPPKMLRLLRNEFPTLILIKSLSLKQAELQDHLSRYGDLVDFFLFDSGAPGQGGTGQHLDSSMLKDLTIPRPFFIAGGIGEREAGLLKEAFAGVENFYGIDVNSNVETAPGIKSPELVKGVLKVAHE